MNIHVSNVKKDIHQISLRISANNVKHRVENVVKRMNTE